MKRNNEQKISELRNIELREAKEILAETYIQNIKALEQSDKPLSTLKEILKHGVQVERHEQSISDHTSQKKHELMIDMAHSPKHIAPYEMSQIFNDKNKLPVIEPILSAYRDVWDDERNKKPDHEMIVSIPLADLEKFNQAMPDHLKQTSSLLSADTSHLEPMQKTHKSSYVALSEEEHRIQTSGQVAPYLAEHITEEPDIGFWNERDQKFTMEELESHTMQAGYADSMSRDYDGDMDMEA